MKLSDLGEFGLIEGIRAKAVTDAATFNESDLGIGDDCSCVSLPAGEALLTSTDMLLENVHFRLDWTDLHSLGRKAVAVNISDLAAMGGKPRHIFLSMAIPLHMTTEQIEQMMDGVLTEARARGARLMGGDTCRSPGPLVLNICVQGTAPPEEVLRRSGAGPNEDLYVSGSLGDSALALKQLLAGDTPSPQALERHHRPVPRVELGRALARRKLARCLIDLSDGLLADLGHILEQSRVGARIDARLLPLGCELESLLETRPELINLALSGGEDYELLFSASLDHRHAIAALASELALPLTRIGHTTAEQGLLVLGRDAAPMSLPRAGFNHFSQEPT